MQIFREIDDLSGLSHPVHLAIGVFDGVHLGHAAVISAALKGAADTGGIPVLVTFDPHPVRVLRPEQAPRILTHTTHKLKRAQGMGVNHALVVAFDENFSLQSGEDFVRHLRKACSDLRQICVGKGWKFGCERSGDFALLEKLGKDLGFQATGVKAFEWEGKPVSSTEIRGLICNGHLELASQMLGNPYSVLGTVVKGNQLGRKLGFPTANLLVHSEQLPPSGVYAVEIGSNRDSSPGVANLGTRPTFEDHSAQRRLEVHLLDYTGEDFYGEDIEVVFRKFLRPEQKFAGPAQLADQIKKDVRQTREFFGAG